MHIPIICKSSSSPDKRGGATDAAHNDRAGVGLVRGKHPRQTKWAHHRAITMQRHEDAAQKRGGEERTTYTNTPVPLCLLHQDQWCVHSHPRFLFKNKGSPFVSLARF